MRFSLLSILNLVFTSFAFGTTDGYTEAYVVVNDMHDEDRFFVQKVPLIGCYGLEKGPQLLQLTKEYLVPYNMGCGMESTLENINYLTCATVVDSTENEDYTNFAEIALDITRCERRNDENFLNAVREAVNLNFSKNTKLKFVTKSQK